MLSREKASVVHIHVEGELLGLESDLPLCSHSYRCLLPIPSILAGYFTNELLGMGLIVCHHPVSDHTVKVIVMVVIPANTQAPSFQ